MYNVRILCTFHSDRRNFRDSLCIYKRFSQWLLTSASLCFVICYIQIRRNYLQFFFNFRGFERVLWNNCFWCEFLICYKLPTCYGRLQKLSFKSSKRAWRVLCCSFSRGETWCYVVACLGKNVFSEKKSDAMLKQKHK